eukprot:592648_1
MKCFLCQSSKNSKCDDENQKRNCTCSIKAKCAECVQKEQKKQLVLQNKYKEQTQLMAGLNKTLQSKQSEYRKIDQIHNKIKEELRIEEEQLMEDFEIERSDPDTKLVVVLGNTGDGKSTFCNRIKCDTSKFGNKSVFVTSHEPQACTKKHFKSTTTINSTQITVVDTPGFYDPAGEDHDRRHGNMLCKYLKGCGGVNAFVLVRNSTNIRYDSSFQEMLKAYQNMFGNDFFNRLIIIATRVDYNNEAYLTMKQDISMKTAICKQFKVNDIPVIPMGIDNYKDAISTFATMIPTDKLECHNISSPINELYSKISLIEKQVEEKKNEINLIQMEIDTTQQQFETDKSLKFCRYIEKIDAFLMQKIGKLYCQATKNELKQFNWYKDNGYDWIDAFLQQTTGEKPSRVHRPKQRAEARRPSRGENREMDGRASAVGRQRVGEKPAEGERPSNG